jgi:hypothetical protein
MVLFYVDDSGDEQVTTFSALQNAEGPPEDGPSETLSKTEYVVGTDDSTKRFKG